MSSLNTARVHTLSLVLYFFTSAHLSIKEHLECVFIISACSYINVTPIKYRLM